LARPIAIALLAKAMGVPARLGLLVAAVSLMSLPSPHFQLAFRTAIALATVATDTDCERRPAGSVRAKPKAENSVRVDIHVSHFENYVIRPTGHAGVDKVPRCAAFQMVGWRLLNAGRLPTSNRNGLRLGMPTRGFEETKSSSAPCF
jgi:hypothetical protein